MTPRRPYRHGISQLVLGILVIPAIAAAIAAGPMQAQEQQNPAAQAQAVAVQRLSQLAACNAELGPLQELRAQVESGRLATFEQFKAAFEKANPGKTVDAKFAAIDKAPESTGDAK